ncbi:MAG: hypothetical protein M3N14_01885 [Bacteroidota bacterium]|nr:hypothetical protein [Bacteroidota bacterium]
MKKTVIGICIALTVASCNGNRTNNNNQTANDDSKASEKKALATPLDKTLNGFDGISARAMIQNFSESFVIDGNLISDDNSKKSVYTWYSLDQINKIDSLLSSEKADGMRIYLGADKRAPGSKKLKVHLFMVSTRKRVTGDPVGNGSKHIDYYTHSAAYLNGTQPFGDGIDDSAKDGPKNGAQLYDKPTTAIGHFPTAVCNDTDPHYIDNNTALTWVQKRGDMVTATSDPTGYNTKSEWIDSSFVHKLFKVMKEHNFSGLRVYLGEGRIDTAGHERDVFILVPTRSSGKIEMDDYSCIADYYNNPFDSILRALKGNKHKLIKKSKGIPAKRTSNSFMWLSDNGELCPDVCN